MQYFTDNTDQLVCDQSLNNPVLYSMSDRNGEGRRGSGHQGFQATTMPTGIWVKEIRVSTTASFIVKAGTLR